MNKKGFTLVELLAVIIVIAIIMSLVLPGAMKVRRNNKTKIYGEYERMMVEYAKVSEYNDEDLIDLIDLEELDKVKKECSGYVEIDHSVEPPKYYPFITCGDEYTTNNYNRSYAKTILPFPVCKSDVIYNGAVQDLVESNPGYTLTNNTRKDVGKQDVVASITNPNDYVWIDNSDTDKTISDCEVMKREVYINAENKSMSYGGEAPSNSYTILNAVNGENPLSSSVTYTIKDSSDNAFTPSASTPVGAYTIVPSATVTSNYRFAAGPGTLTVTRAIIEVPTCSSHTYNGSSQTLFESHSTGTYTNDSISGTDAGNYGVTLTPTANYQWNNEDPTNPIEITCMVSPKSVSVTWGSTTTFGYDGSEQAPTASATSGVTGETINVTRTTASAVSSNNYTSTASCSSVSGGRGKCSNYTLANNTKSYTIGKGTNPITVTASQSWSATFSTSAQTKALTAATNAQGTVTYAINSQPSGSYFTISGSTLTMKASTPVGSYSVVVRATAAGNSNYNSGYKDITVTVTVGKAANPITVTAAQSWGPSFSTSAQTKTITAASNGQGTVSYSITSQPSGSYFSISGTTLTMKASTPAGTYSVVVKAEAAGNSNYNSGSKNITMTVTVGKASNPIAVTATQSWGPTFSTSAQTKALTTATGAQGSVTYSISSQPSGSYFTISGSTLTMKASTPVGTYSVVVKAEAAGNSNYNSGSKNITMTVTVGKAGNPISVTSAQSWSASFSTSAQTKALTTATGAQGTVTYSITSQPSGSYFTISSSTLTMKASTPVGSYSVVVKASAAGNSNYNSGSKNITVSVTVSKSNATCPTISDWTGTYDGSQHSINVSGGSGGSIQYKWLNTSDSWRDTKPSASVVGTYKVYVQVKGDSNHNTVDCSYKTLTINRAKVDFPPCASVAYNGAKQILFAAHSTGEYTNSALTGVFVGTYSVTLTPTSNYQWSSGSNVTSGRSLSCSITGVNRWECYYEKSAGNIVSCDGNPSSAPLTSQRWVYYNTSGTRVQSGWVQTGDSSLNPDSNSKKEWYYFSGGYAYLGWYQDPSDKCWYYLSTFDSPPNPNGSVDAAALTNMTINIDGNPYSFAASGRCYSGNGCSASCNH